MKEVTHVHNRNTEAQMTRFSQPHKLIKHPRIEQGPNKCNYKSYGLIYLYLSFLIGVFHMQFICSEQ